MGTTIESDWENTRLRAELEAARAEIAHWKNNHATEVRRARILKERTDMPIERVAAYEQWGKDQRQLAAEQAKNVRLLEAFTEVRNSLQFANDSPNGGINDTLWMMHRTSTIFDFMDSVLVAASLP